MEVIGSESMVSLVRTASSRRQMAVSLIRTGQAVAKASLADVGWKTESRWDAYGFVKAARPRIYVPFLHRPGCGCIVRS